MQTYGDCPACGLRTYTYHDYEPKLLRCPSCNAPLEALEMDLEGLVDERGQVPIEPVWRGHQPFCPIHGEPAVLGASGAYWCECRRQVERLVEEDRALRDQRPDTICVCGARPRIVAEFMYPGATTHILRCEACGEEWEDLPF